jgi:membrane-associated phospholipid phosphatase
MTVSEVIARVKSNWLLKVQLGIALTAMFAIFYHLPQRYPLFPATAMHPTWIDQMIPFMPNSVYLYESLWFLTPIAPWLMTSKVDLRHYSMGLLFMYFIGFCCFFFHPTLSPRPTDIQDANMLYKKLVLIDNELNAFPSLHAAGALFHGACCHVTFCTGAKHRLLRWFVWIWALGIIASTLLTKQHVFVDVVAGTILGLGSFAIFCRPSKMSWGHKE